MEEDVITLIEFTKSIITTEADEEVIELAKLIKHIHQANLDNYAFIKPRFDKLNLYCNEQSFRFEIFCLKL